MLLAIGTLALAAAVPTPSSSALDGAGRAELGAKILYVNFDGGTITNCSGSRPRDNCSTLVPAGGVDVLPYSGDALARASIIQLLRERVADFGITVTNVRPGNTDYDMEMVGDWEGMTPAFAGIAPYGDCWDNGGGEISFSLEADDSVDGMAEVILQELAHTWGLDHVDSQQDLLYPTVAGDNKTFVDECLQVVELQGNGTVPATGTCSHHIEACGSFEQQNSYAELLLIFGPSEPDTTPPTVTIVSPADAGRVPDGDFDLVLSLSDDQKPSILETTITITGDALATPIVDTGPLASPDEPVFPIAGLADGAYTIEVVGLDEAGNEGRATALITVGGPTGDTGTTTMGVETDGGQDTDPSGTDSDPAQTDEGDAGCGCVTASQSTVDWAWLLLAFGLRRRRPPHRPPHRPGGGDPRHAIGPARPHSSAHGATLVP